MDLELTTREVADLLGLSPGRVRQFICTGRIRSRKIGNTRLIRVEEIHALTAERSKTKTARTIKQGEYK